MTESKLAPLEIPLERPPVAYARSLSSRNSSSESLSLSITLNTRKLSALPLSLHTQPSSDHIRTRCKQLIMDYKELQNQLSRFKHRSSQLSKTNTLRLSLLRFLRLQTDQFMKPGSYEKDMHTFVEKTAAYGTKVLAHWWTVLLDDLTASGTTSAKLSNVDRSAYLECVSRILARREWNLTKRTSGMYSEHLTLTLDYCFTRLIPMKTTPLAINAFVGKVFAYCFFEVEDFAPLLLFTLFVKNYTLTKLVHSLPSKLPDGSSSDSRIHPSLIKFIDYIGEYEDILSRDEYPPKFLGATCMQPPKMTTFDELEIDLKDNTWVKKWAGFGSDIFCSFLKHYLTLAHDNIGMSTQASLFHAPGYIIIHAHIVEIFDSSVAHIKKFRAAQFNDQNGYNEVMITASFSGQGNTRQDISKLIAKLPIISIFGVLRSMIYECDERLGLSSLHSIESIMKAKAERVHAYDSATCEAIYDIFSELLIHLQHDSQRFSRQLDWNFWITGLVRMIQTGHMICQVKSLCFMFNIWNLLPIDLVLEGAEKKKDSWILNQNLTVIYNLSAYMISKSVWEDLFGHWNPLIRHFYNRLVVFKIIGTSNDNYGSYLAFKKTVKERLNSTYDLFKKDVGGTELSMVQQLEIVPANPIVNKKLIITPVDQLGSSSSASMVNILDSFSMSVPYQSLSNSATSSTSTLLLPSNRKIYAYDIFDDAIYSSSIGSSTPGNPTMAKTLSTRSSMGSMSPSFSSASIKRSSSGSSLGRVPVLGTALSFFKKFNGSQPNLQTSPLQSPLSSPVIPEEGTNDMLKPSPYLNPNPSSVSSMGSRSPGYIKRSPSMLSSPTSSISEISDEDPDAFLSIPKNRHSSKSPSSLTGSATSRVSSFSSSTSLASLNSMDALPTPPELARKIPELKRFKYKFQLAFSSDAMQFQSRVTKCKKTKFFRDPARVEMPSRPMLPFEKAKIGLLNDESYANLGESDEDDDDDFGEFLIIPRKSTQSYSETRETEMFAELKNHLLLGRFLSEWKGVVDEYEKFMSYTNEFVTSDENTFIDPMLVADIPPIKVK